MNNGTNMERALKEVAQNTGKKSIFSIFASGKGSTIKTVFEHPIILPEDHTYSVALCALHTSYSWPNLDIHNNKFIYHDRTEWKTIRFPVGTYNLDNINSHLQEVLEEKDMIKIYGDGSTLKTVIEIEDGYQVKFPEIGGLGDLLGFEPRTFTSGKYQGDSIVEITAANSVLVQCDLINSSYIDGKKSNVIFTFNVIKQPGTRISISPKNLLYYPLAFNVISSFTVRLCNQKSELLNLRGEYLSVFFDIQQA